MIQENMREIHEKWQQRVNDISEKNKSFWGGASYEKQKAPGFRSFYNRYAKRAAVAMAGQENANLLAGNSVDPGLGAQMELMRKESNLEARNMMSRNTNRMIGRQGFAGDSKVSAFLGEASRSNYNNMIRAQNATRAVNADSVGTMAANSSLDMASSVKGLRLNLDNIYDRNNAALAQINAGGGLWGEVASGVGSAIGSIAGAKEYSRLYSGG